MSIGDFIYLFGERRQGNLLGLEICSIFCSFEKAYVEFKIKVIMRKLNLK